MAISFRIFKIKTNQFAYFDDRYSSSKKLNIKSKYEFKISDDYHIVVCKAIFEFFQEDNLLIKSDVECLFEINPSAIKEIIKENKIPASDLQYLASIVTGIVRGIIHAKTEGTALNAIILPPINLVELIKDDFIIS